MASRVRKAKELGLINPPPWLPDNTMFECMMGSIAYGASGDSSDMDIYGFCMPPKDVVFPHLAGHIPGFGKQPPKFEVWQEHHVKDTNARKEYDFAIYSLVRFFQLCMDNNPNMVDALFAPRRCVLHSTALYEHVRDNRELFLHKGSWYKFRGYANSQMSKLDAGSNRKNPKRQADIEKHGWDLKFGYHIVRLFLECEQIMETGTLRLDRDSEVYKSIRAGEWSLERLKEWVSEKEASMELLYANSKLPNRAPESKLKTLLLECLEMHYGSLEKAVVEEDKHGRLVRELEELVSRHK